MLLIKGGMEGHGPWPSSAQVAQVAKHQESSPLPASRRSMKIPQLHPKLLGHGGMGVRVSLPRPCHQTLQFLDPPASPGSSHQLLPCWLCPAPLAPCTPCHPLAKAEPLCGCCAVAMPLRPIRTRRSRISEDACKCFGFGLLLQSHSLKLP